MKPSQNKSKNLNKEEIAKELSTAADWKILSIENREKKRGAPPKEPVFQPVSKRFERTGEAPIKK